MISLYPINNETYFLSNKAFKNFFWSHLFKTFSYSYFLFYLNKRSLTFFNFLIISQVLENKFTSIKLVFFGNGIL